jgi:hypothetical protein
VAVTAVGMDWAVRRVDAMLRQRQGIFEFSNDPDCIFRISLGRAGRLLTLSDGVAIRPHDAVVQIHYWNEQMPPIPKEGRSALWAARFRNGVVHSLSLLAEALTRERRFADVAAIFAAPAFAAGGGPAITTRLSTRLGFDVLDGPSSDGSIHAWFDSLLIWVLMRTFNPASVRGRGLAHDRVPIWMSRSKLLTMYGPESGTALRPAAMMEPS